MGLRGAGCAVAVSVCVLVRVLVGDRAIGDRVPEFVPYIGRCVRVAGVTGVAAREQRVLDPKCGPFLS